MTNTARQKDLFEDIHDKYYEGTTDKYALAYKDEYVYTSVLEYAGNPSSVIELACGIGAGVGYLKQHLPDLDFAGCDISQKAVDDFATIHGKPCYVLDLTKPVTLDRTFDVAIVMGGIHHLVADLDQAFENIARLLNKGGLLIMAEPNADYVLEPFRKAWYAIDKGNFDSGNEHALSHNRLAHTFDKKFKPLKVKYFGGPAYYLLTLNYILRLPNWTKKWMAPALMAFERAYHLLPGPYPYASFIACWQKR